MGLTDPKVSTLAPHPLVPVPYEVVAHDRETADVVTLSLAPLDGKTPPFLPGQFNMLSAFGVGEAAISISSGPNQDVIQHTVRDVGPVTHALCETELGGLVGIRGPFGNDWGVGIDERDGPTGDVVVVAGGIGLAPLRGAVDQLVSRHPMGASSIFVLVGARSPDQIIFARQLESWKAAGAHVAVCVDVAPEGWVGHVGVVTSLLADAPFESSGAMALVCGPEVMLRFSARALVGRGLSAESVRLALERNMQCGIGSCGHCQLGPWLLCRDGPIVTWASGAATLLGERER
jgi:anaerobic sulfite reductase subunit B